ncbi:MAG: peptidase [Waterburya sp.]
MNQWRLRWQKLLILMLATCLVALISKTIIVWIQPSWSSALPSSQIHALPKSLEDWQDQSNSGDYFNQVKSTPMGYLIWSQFPVKVFVEQPISVDDSAASQRFQQWVEAAKSAIADWNVYFPLKEVTKRELADILILRSQPEREATLNPNTGLYNIPRAVTAETNYSFYLKQNPTLIAHRMTLVISPDFTGVSLLATIRHELGHALGIWGHSPQESDALYFSQVSDPPPISHRDINTLKKIYQQPTKLGWKI